jgi:ketosteroid isomerase-like protein
MGHERYPPGVFLDLQPTGTQIEIPGASVFTLRGGKVAQVQMYWDSGHLQRQLGCLLNSATLMT